jgi:hypothetical protein
VVHSLDIDSDRGRRSFRSYIHPSSPRPECISEYPSEVLDDFPGEGGFHWEGKNGFMGRRGNGL